MGMSQKVRKVIIPVAGFGTRFLPATKAMPKEMLPILDKPVIQYVVEEAVASGITDIILVTSHTKRVGELAEGKEKTWVVERNSTHKPHGEFYLCATKRSVWKCHTRVERESLNWG